MRTGTVFTVMHGTQSLVPYIMQEAKSMTQTQQEVSSKMVCDE